MNINGIMLGLEDVTGLEVEEDSYTGKADEYIVFNYADVRGSVFGDDEELLETASMIINVNLIKCKRGAEETNYHAIRRAIKSYLQKHDAYDISYSVYSEKTSDQDEIRHLVFECKFTKEEEE
jgi:hypothetical protein